MALTIKLYVHGVPMGQKIWGPKDGDVSYIETFYGKTFRVSEQMLVESLSIGGQTNCYYTYVCGQNMFASDGRAGSYIALTVRINAYYADLQNMYNILNAAFTKVCVGQCIKPQGEGYKFCISDFSQVDEQMQKLEKDIIGYIGEFSNNDDLASLSSINTAVGNGCAEINLLECDKSTAFATMKSNGRIAVSALYPTKQLAKVIAEKDAQMKEVQERCLRDKQALQEDANKKYNQLQQQLTELQNSVQHKLDVQRQDYEKKFAEIKLQYDCDETIKKLSAQLKQEKETLRKSKISFDSLQKDYDKVKAENERLRNANMCGSMNDTNNMGWNNNSPKDDSIIGKIKELLPFVNTFILLCLFVAMLCTGALQRSDEPSTKSENALNYTKETYDDTDVAFAPNDSTKIDTISNDSNAKSNMEDSERKVDNPKTKNKQ